MSRRRFPARCRQVRLLVGGSLFLMGRTHEMLARLQKYFPDLWQRIYVTALLRALREPYFRRLQVHYETSFLAHAFPGIAFTPQQNANFLQSLGRRRTAIAQFMKEDVNRSDVFILFDGHRLITSSKTTSTASGKIPPLRSITSSFSAARRT